MNRLLCQDLWPKISKLAKKSVKRGAIAYVASDEFVQFTDGDLLVCDASQSAIKSGQTDARVLKRAFDRGATLYSLQGLHAKILLLDEKALIGSANASGWSATNLVEAALLTDQPSIVALAQDLVGQLASQATPLTEQRLKRLLAIEVVRRPFRQGLPRGRLKTSAGKIRTWVIGTTEILNDGPEDQEVVEATAENCRQDLSNPRSSVEWLRWTGRSKFREQCGKGDWVIQMWSADGRKTPSSVYGMMPILGRKDFNTATYFFVETFPRAVSQAKGWMDFKALAVRAGIRRKITPGSHFEIEASQADTLQSLWAEKRR